MSSTENAPEAPNAPHSPGRALPRWLRALLVFMGSTVGMLLAGVLAVALSVALGMAVAYPNLPDTSSLTDYKPKLPLRLFTIDGQSLGEFGEERRTFVPIAAIPKVMKDAVLAIEDANFYNHSGVDYKGALRAALAQFNEAKSQGASTITMQLARNFYLSTEKTFTRKVYEILLAFKIESLLSKDQILEVYMNQIFLGHRAYGFAAASDVYFGKPLKDLTVAEAAMLAGLPKAPSAYNPLTNPRRATTRQRYIIERMLENQFITQAQRDEALAQTLKYHSPAEPSVHAEYAAEAARQLVFAQYGDETYTRGLNVQLTIHSSDQLVAYRALRKGLLEFDRRQAYRGPENFIDLPRDNAALDTRIAEALSEHPDYDELRAAVVLEASPRKVVAVLQSGDSLTITGEGLRAAWSGLNDKAATKVQIRRGAVVRVVRGAKGEWALTQVPEVEGAFVALDPRTGAVRAMVGGFDYGRSKFNHVTQAWRQPGSTFKPFIYSAALEKGFTPGTLINDAPLFFDAAETGSQPWEPKNYDGYFHGPMTLKTGLSKSKNMVSIRVLQSTGPEFAQQWLTRFGFDLDKHPPYLTLALGAGSVTPLQMATGYGVFANGGYRVPPTLIASITDSRTRAVQQSPLPVLGESLRAIEPRNAFVMSNLLNEVTRTGTAMKAQSSLKRVDVYGKTGTTNESMDAWFAGYHASMVAVVWIGYDTPRKMGTHETGGGLALPIWVDYMAYALQNQPLRELAVPPTGLVQVGNDWTFAEFTGGRGIGSVGMEDKLPTSTSTAAVAAPSPDERKSILDLFR